MVAASSLQSGLRHIVERSAIVITRAEAENIRDQS